MIRRLGLKRRIDRSLLKGAQVAAQRDLILRVATDRDLFLDIDTPEHLARYHAMVPYLRRYLHLDEVSVTPSRGGGDGLHIILHLPHPLTHTERIALQAILGSDPMREWLTLLRVWAGDPHPIHLFEVPSDAR